MDYVYVLKLKKHKWYIGKTKNVAKRFQEHWSGRAGVGAEWTKYFEPIQIEEERVMKTPHDEDNVTLEYMCRYGMDNVRGGNYTQPVLSQEEKEAIQRAIYSHLDLCRGC